MWQEGFQLSSSSSIMFSNYHLRKLFRLLHTELNKTRPYSFVLIVVRQPIPTKLLQCLFPNCIVKSGSVYL